MAGMLFEASVSTCEEAERKRGGAEDIWLGIVVLSVVCFLLEEKWNLFCVLSKQGLYTESLKIRRGGDGKVK